MPQVLRVSGSNVLTLTGAITASGFEPEQKHQDWMRWIYASIITHFTDRKGPHQLYIEGDERIQNDLGEFAELRIDGPFIHQPQRGLYQLDVEINVLVQTHMDPRRFYKTYNAIGAFIKAFTNKICVYKYGDGPFDDGTLLGTLKLKLDPRDKVDINHYGIIREDTRLVQSTVEGHYRIELWNESEL